MPPPLLLSLHPEVACAPKLVILGPGLSLLTCHRDSRLDCEGPTSYLGRRAWVRLQHEVGSERPAGWGHPPSEMGFRCRLGLASSPRCWYKLPGPPSGHPACLGLPGPCPWDRAAGQGVICIKKQNSPNPCPPRSCVRNGGGWQEWAGHILHLATPGCVRRHQERLCWAHYIYREQFLMIFLVTQNSCY